MPRSKRKLWTEENMLAAIEAVKDGESVRKAAMDFNVPKSTLGDRVSGRTEHGKKSGPEQILALEDEKKLAAYLIDVSKQGYGKSKEIILYMATQIAIKRGKEVKGCLSEMWWRNFLKRNPEISLRATQNFGLVRTLVKRETIEAFYKRLLETLTTNEYGSLLDKPHLILNCDESGFEFDAINKIVAAARGAKHIPRVSKGQHEKVTVLACASAAGNTLPPMFIYKSLSGRVPNGVQEGAPAGTLFTAQKSGWIDKDLYLKWFTELFLKQIPQERPVLLLVDGHKAHVTQEVIEAATRNRVSIFCLPAHSSHFLQPLDLSLFGPLKRGWVKACAAFSHLTSTVMNQRNFAKIFNVAWHSSTTPEVIRGGFKRAGIFPYDPSMFDFEKLAPTIRQSTDSVSSTSGNAVLISATEDTTTSQVSTAGEASGSRKTTTTENVIPSSPDILKGDPWLTPSQPQPQVDVLFNTPESRFEVSSAYEALISLENKIGKVQREKFRRRFQNGYDVPGDHQYYAWLDLFMEIGGGDNSGDCPCNSACSCSCAGIGFCDCLNDGCFPRRKSAARSLAFLPTPSAPSTPPAPPSPPAQPTPPSVSGEYESPQNSSPAAVGPSTPSVTQPYTISTPAGAVEINEDLCGIMLQPRRNITGTRKRAASTLDPGNKCITGQVFLEALRSETERKEKEKREKEEKRKERERVSAEKKKKAQERKERLKEKAEKRKKAEEVKKAKTDKNTKKKSTKRRRVEKADEKERYLCDKCGKEYNKEEDSTWVECDYCSNWFHFKCTDLPVLDDLDGSIDYTCEKCELEGFPSHNTS